MPYAYDPNRREDEEDPNNPPPQVAGSGQLFGGGGETTGQGETAASKPTDSGRFQNLNSYLDANQASQFGTQFADKVNTDVNAAGSAQVQGEQAFKDNVDKSVVKQDKGLVDSAINDPYAYLGGAASADAGKLKGFQDQYNASYQGPNQYSDSQDAYQKAYGATQKAQDVSQAAQSEPGRFALLDNYFGQSSGRQGDYTQGQKGLDNLLVQGDKGAQDSLAQARANAQTSASNFEGQKKTASDYAAAGRGTTEATQNYARGQLGTDKAGNLATTGAIPDYLKGLDASVTQRQADAGTDYAALRASLSKAADLKNLTPAQLKTLGLDSYSGVNYQTPNFHVSQQQDPNARFAINPDFGANNRVTGQGKSSLFGLTGNDVAGYASRLSDSNINRGSVQTAEGARRLKALEQLGGLSANVSNYDDAGKYTSGNLAQFRSDDFGKKLNTERNNAQGGFDALNTQYQSQADAFNSDPLNARYGELYAAQNYRPVDHGEADFNAGMPYRQNLIKQDMAAKYDTEAKALKAKYKL